MGIIIAKFRKKPSTFDVLTKLENDITSIEEFQKRTQQTQRKIVFRFLLLAICIYAALAFSLYFYFSQIPQHQRLWCIPLIVVAVPLGIWLVKIFLTWYYNRKLKRNEKKLVTLKEKKKKILETVMETETYNVAKQILDKFGNELKKPVISTPQVQKATPATGPKNYDTLLRRRTVAAQNTMRGRASFGGPPETPVLAAQQRLAIASPRNSRLSPTSGAMVLSQTPSLSLPSLPRSILSRDRSVLDKMVDYLVGDGPSNRYALICQKCSSHNGMALKEEFEYLAFKCCYCGCFNPARKKRPAGKFDSPLMLTPSQRASNVESSDSEKNSETDSDNETNPIIEEPRSDSPDIAVAPPEDARISDAELPGDEQNLMEVDDSIGDQNTAKTTDSGPAEKVVDAGGDVSDK